MPKIVQKENKILRGKSREVPFEEIGSEKINKILRNMVDSLSKTKDGVALAAPQIGVPLSIFIIKGEYVEPREEDTLKEKEEKPGLEAKLPSESTVSKFYYFINPRVLKISKKKQTVREGCLSVSGIYGTLDRAEKITIQAYNEKGEKITRGASGLLAQIFQHEIDHLNGVLFIDSAYDLEKIEK